MITYKQLNQIILESYREDLEKGYSIIHNKGGVKVHDVRMHDAMTNLGQGTKWKTAENTHEGQDTFERYTGLDKYGNQKNRDGESRFERGEYRDYDAPNEKKVYVVHAKDENGNPAKYKFHHDGAEYYDKDYNEVDLHKLVKTNHELKNVKEFQGEHPALTSDENYERHKHYFRNNANLVHAYFNDERTPVSEVKEGLKSKKWWEKAAAEKAIKSRRIVK